MKTETNGTKIHSGSTSVVVLNLTNTIQSRLPEELVVENILRGTEYIHFL